MQTLYQRLFQREAEAEGVEYWVNGGGATIPFDLLITALANGIGITDRQTLDNKSIAAQFYTANISTDLYTQISAQSAVDSVDATLASINASKETTLLAAKGKTNLLTSAIDTLPGSAKNDVFLGVVSDTRPPSDSFNPEDVLNGGEGIDTLSLTVTGSHNEVSISPTSISNIETINIEALLSHTSTQTKVKANKFLGATEFYADRAISAVSFLDLSTNQAGGIKGDNSLKNSDLTLQYTDSATSGIINIANGTTQGTIKQLGNGITANTLNSIGAANVVNDISLSGSENTLLHIQAQTRLKTDNITGFTGNNATITISGNAANDGATRAVNIGTIESNTVANIDASGLSVGGLQAVLSNNARLQLKGGAGNDLITTTGVLTSGCIDAGTGSADTLVVTDSSHIATRNLGDKYQNFETLVVKDNVLFDMENIKGINAININGNVRETTGVINLTAQQASAINVSRAPGELLVAVKGATTEGQLDEVTMRYDDGDAITHEEINFIPKDFSQSYFSNITSAGVETFNWVAIDNIKISSTMNMSDWSTINISGGGYVYLNTDAQVINDNAKITILDDTHLRFEGQLTTGAGITITTGSAADSISMSNNDLQDIINSGAGNDVIKPNGEGIETEFGYYGTNKVSDTITSGAGFDYVEFSVGGSIDQIDYITDLALGTSDTRIDRLALAGIGGETLESVIYITTAQQTVITAQSSFKDAVNAAFAIANTDGNVSVFNYASDSFLVANGSGNSVYTEGEDILVKVTGVSGSLDTDDFHFV